MPGADARDMEANIIRKQCAATLGGLRWVEMFGYSIRLYPCKPVRYKNFTLANMIGGVAECLQPDVQVAIPGALDTVAGNTIPKCIQCTCSS